MLMMRCFLLRRPSYAASPQSADGKPRAGTWHMQAHAGTWYYAYTIDGDTVTIQDACHQQNMHEDDK